MFIVSLAATRRQEDEFIFDHLVCVCSEKEEIDAAIEARLINMSRHPKEEGWSNYSEDIRKCYLSLEDANM